MGCFSYEMAVYGMWWILSLFNETRVHLGEFLIFPTDGS